VTAVGIAHATKLIVTDDPKAILSLGKNGFRRELVFGNPQSQLVPAFARSIGVAEF
jgi:hypothetical protein